MDDIVRRIPDLKGWEWISLVFFISLKLATLGYRIMVNVGPEKPLVKHTAVTVGQKTVRVV